MQQFETWPQSPKNVEVGLTNPQEIAYKFPRLDKSQQGNPHRFTVAGFFVPDAWVRRGKAIRQRLFLLMFFGELA